MAEPISAVMEELDVRVREIGFEVVTVEWAGTDHRPILRLRIDHIDGLPDRSVDLDECTRVSRRLESWLDDLPEVPEGYTLEVSSPGVERPLTRTKDFARFAGHPVAVKGPEILADRATYLEGKLLGLEEEEEGPGRIRLELPGGDVVILSLDELSGAHLRYEW